MAAGGWAVGRVGGSSRRGVRGLAAVRGRCWQENPSTRGGGGRVAGRALAPRRCGPRRLPLQADPAPWSTPSPAPPPLWSRAHLAYGVRVAGRWRLPVSGRRTRSAEAPAAVCSSRDTGPTRPVRSHPARPRTGPSSGPRSPGRSPALDQARDLHLRVTRRVHARRPQGHQRPRSRGRGHVHDRRQLDRREAARAGVQEVPTDQPARRAAAAQVTAGTVRACSCSPLSPAHGAPRPRPGACVAGCGAPAARRA